MSLMMMMMMNGIANTVLILIALPILGRCSFAMTSHQNGTHASSLMFIADDVECLAQMPVTDLMKIRNTIKIMHAVTAYDALHRQPPTHATELETNGQNQNRSDSDSPLRELDESVSETKHVIKYLSRFTTSTTKSPMAEAYMMNSQMHDELIRQQQQHQQLTYERKIGSISTNLFIRSFFSHRVLFSLDASHFTAMNNFFSWKNIILGIKLAGHRNGKRRNHRKFKRCSIIALQRSHF